MSCSHPDPAALSLDAAFQDMRDPEDLCDLLQITRRASLVLHHGGAANDLKVGHLRQRRQNFLLNAVTKGTVLFVVAKVLERENRNALLRDRTWERRFGDCGNGGRVDRFPWMPKPVGGQGKHGDEHTGQTDDPGATTIGGGERATGPEGPRDRTIVNIETPSQDESNRKT